jgi:hypothetical protein
MTSMRFEERELKPYSESVSAAGLKEGSVYFAVNYVDDEMLIPTLEPFVFVGRDLDFGDDRQVYFQDVASYREGIRHDSDGSNDQARFWSGSEKEINQIFEYESAMDELMRCALRRRKAPPER